MPMIVSENKQDPTEPWLVRDDKYPHHKGTPYKAAIAHGVRFMQLSCAESGTELVAICDSVQGFGKEQSIPAHCFRINQHEGKYLDPDGIPVEKCDTLYCMHDGKRFGALLAEVEKAAA